MAETMAYEEDPERCQAMMGNKQCCYKGMKLSNGTRASCCEMHGGARDQKIVESESLRNYRLTKFQAKLERHADSGGLKNLREEVAILRVIMEEKLNMCNDTNDLLLHAGMISDLVLKIEKVVASCHKLEGAMGQLLDKQAILQFAGEMIAIISDEIKDATVIDRITGRLMSALGRIGTEMEDGQ